MTAEALPALERYRLIRRVAAGGMAEVFLGERVGPSGFAKQVAIKCLMPHLAADATFLEMFLDEARLVAMLHHPNLVPIFDVGTIENRICMVMDYVDGASLAEVHRRAVAAGAGQVPTQVACEILAQACDGLASAHQFRHPATGVPLGLVHRDVTPHNMLVSRDGGVLVTDFGIAKATTNQHESGSLELKGKIAYMAPEQIQRRPADPRVDVWALGAVLFELVTGRRLFVAENQPQLIHAVLEMQLEGPLSVLPAPLRTVAQAALERNPEKRTASALELGRQLRAVGGSPDRQCVASWAAPLLPADGHEAAGPVEELVSLSSGDLEVIPAARRTTPRQWRRTLYAGLFAAISIALAWWWRKPEGAEGVDARAPSAVNPADPTTANPTATANPKPTAQPTPPPIATANPSAATRIRLSPPLLISKRTLVPLASAHPVAGSRSIGVAAPRSLRVIGARAAPHPAPVAPAPADVTPAVSKPDLPDEDNDVGLVNPFHSPP